MWAETVLADLRARACTGMLVQPVRLHRRTCAARARNSANTVSAHTRKGTNGVSTDGVTANFTLFDGGTFGVLPLTYFYIPLKCQGVPFSSICQNS